MTHQTDRLSRNKSRPGSAPTPLNDIQHAMVFACIFAARHQHGFGDDDERFSMDNHKSTMTLFKPHMRKLKLEYEPPFNVVRKIWLNFVRSGLIQAENTIRYNYSDSIDEDDDDDESQQSDQSSEQKNEEYLPQDRTRQRSAERKDSPNSSTLTKFKIAICCIVVLMGSILILAHDNSTVMKKLPQTRSDPKINYEMIDIIGTKYSDSLDNRELIRIRNRVKMMNEDVSVLVILGQQRDKTCKIDPTHCIGNAIANITELPYGYIDAADPGVSSRTIVDEVSRGLVDGSKHVMVVDSLEQLKGSEVMGIFPLIDKNETIERRGLLVFVVYAGQQINEQCQDSVLVENVLLRKWSPYVPQDTLTSVISRLTVTIVRTQ